jgi:hypothetical protein
MNITYSELIVKKLLIPAFISITSFSLTAYSQTNINYSRINFEVINNTWCFDPITITLNDSLIFDQDVALYSYPACKVSTEGNKTLTAQLGKYEKTKVSTILNVGYGSEYNFKLNFKSKRNQGILEKVSEKNIIVIDPDSSNQQEFTDAAIIDQEQEVLNVESEQKGYYSSEYRDVIVRTNGDKIFCDITKVDDERIYFNILQNNTEISSFLDRNHVQEYKTDVTLQKEKMQLNYKGNLFCLTFDPLNFIFSGPTITGELILQGKDKYYGFGILSGYRVVKWGWMARELLWSDLKLSSYTVPIAFRIYYNAGEKADGVFIGPYMEFGKLRYADREEEQIKAFGLEYGFKYVWDNQLTIELSIIVGRLKYGTPEDWTKMWYPAVSLKLGYTI